MNKINDERLIIKMDYLIIAEKIDAAKNIANALGGLQGTYAGKTYAITELAGHVMELVDPDEMVDDANEKEKIKTWKLENLPWDLQNFNWKYRVSKGKSRYLKQLKDRIKKYDPQGLVIATDPDPSGEGDLIAWEAIDYVGWNGPVYRMDFESEDAEHFKKAFENLRLIPDKNKDEAYMAAKARQRFDFGSMQHSRAATIDLENVKIKGVIRVGRLKSVIINYVKSQIDEHQHYVKKPFYRVRWKDDAGHVYTMPDETTYKQKTDADEQCAKEEVSPVSKVTRRDRFVTPPSLVSLSDIAGRLSKQGFGPKDVEATYQKMYHDHVVSYPRTEDSKVSMEQYQQIAALAPAIAKCIGLDASVLTHPEPRKKYIKKGAKHGANRPYTNVPSSLDEVETKYGKCGRAIYDLMAKNFLATMMNDAVYDHYDAELENHAKFSMNILKQKNWKEIYQVSTDNDETTGVPPIEGQIAKPFVDEGVNPRTPLPTQARIYAYLKKVDVGTGATRVSTVGDLIGRELKVNKAGKVTLTALGEANGLMLYKTMIGMPETTENLQSVFRKMYQYESVDSIYDVVTKLLKRDMVQFEKNAQAFKDNASQDAQKALALKEYVKKDDQNSFEVEYKGQTGRIKYDWGGERLTDDQVKALQAGKEISVVRQGRKGMYTVNLKVGKTSYQGHKYIGLISSFK